MSSQPFFTIVIPSRNREHLVGDAIWSVLRQTFLDFEVVVLDNSDEGQECMSSMPDDDRVRYVRSGGLSMPDNWERAFNEARGQFICILSDRLVWSSKHFLCVLFDRLQESKCEVASWKFEQARRLGMNTASRSGLFCTYRSDDVLNAMFDMNCRFFSDVGPRGLNSAISRDVIQRLQETTGRACHPYSPDYTLAASVLMATDKILHLDANLVYEQGLDVSNGLLARSEFGRLCKAISALGGPLEGSYQFVPAKFPSLNNSIVNDVVATLRKWGKEVPLSAWNAEKYIMLLHADLNRFALRSDCSDLYQQLCDVAIDLGVPPPPPLQVVRRLPVVNQQRFQLTPRRIARGIRNRAKRLFVKQKAAEPDPSREAVAPSIRDLVEQYEGAVICRRPISESSETNQPR